MSNVELVTLRSGRRVAVHNLATGNRGTIVLSHAAPGAGSFDPDPEATRDRNVTLIGVDRPGYGESEPRPTSEWSTIGDAADDIAEVLDLRGIRSAGIAGWSAGGRVALALAARRPDLVDRVAVIAARAPHDAVPWQPRDEAAIEAFRRQAPAEVHAAIAAQVARAVPAVPGDLSGLGMLGRGPADDAVLAGERTAERLAAMLAAAFRQGTAGLAADIAGYTIRPWDFDLSGVRAKTLLVYGAADPIAASAHGRWWQRNLQDARLEMSPGAGHFLIVPRWARVLAHLAPATRA